MTKDFFISYNKADRQWAEWIAWSLEEAGYSTIIQAWDFRPGGHFVLEMQRATAEAKRTIAVLSEDYLRSLFTQPEWAAAFVQDPNSEKAILLPVRVQKCELKGFLASIVNIDLVGLGEERAKEILLSGANQARAKPASPPSFPGEKQVEDPIHRKPKFPGAHSDDNSPNSKIGNLDVTGVPVSLLATANSKRYASRLPVVGAITIMIIFSILFVFYLFTDRQASVKVLGQVVDEGGRGIAGANVYVIGYEIEGITTGEGGHFQLPAHVPPGDEVWLYARKGQLATKKLHPAGDLPVLLTLKEKE